jgi:membrane protein involved in colicin uptake
MQNTFLKVAAYSAFAAVLGLTGCASSETTRMIEENQKAAAEATSLANQALKAASEASRKADAAMSTARMAEQCCAENQEKINRVFEKSMRK